ncbi:MAG: hypothetical protein QOE11_3407 [Solirubrobacteraceae bacterium]|nr:hypothetical protein [Solirubrobacteraceae bacterium]
MLLLRRKSAAVLIALVASGVSAGSARAASPWSASAVVSPTLDTIADSVSVGFGADGHGVVSWRYASDPLHPSLLKGATALARVNSAGRVGGRFDVSRGVVGEPVMLGRDRYALLRRGARCSDPFGCVPDGTGTRVRLTVAFGRTTGGLGRAREIDRFTGGGDAMIAGNRRGQLAVVYTERRAGDDVVWLVQRAPDRPFSRPRAVARGPGIGQAVVAVGDHGEVLAVYSRAGRLHARLRAPGHGLGRAQDLGPAADLFAMTAAVTPRGRALVAGQYSRLVGIGGIPDSAMTVRLTTRGARAARFGAMRLLDRARIVGGLTPKILVAVDPHSAATFAWNSASTAAPYLARARRIDARGRIGPTRDLPLTDVGGLAARPNGTVAIVGQGALRTFPGPLQTAREIVATLSTTAGTFLPAELIALAPGGANPAVAVNPKTGQPTAVWYGTGPTGTTTVQIATRT